MRPYDGKAGDEQKRAIEVDDGRRVAGKNVQVHCFGKADSKQRWTNDAG